MGKYAVLLNASTDDVGPAVNGLEYAIELDDAGHDVDIYLDGIATRWPGQFVEKPDHPVNDHFGEAEERGIVAGACGYCAHSFGAMEGIEASNVDLLSGPEEHAPRASELVEEGYDLLPIG